MRDSRPPLDATFFQTVQARRIAVSFPLRSYFRRILGVDPSSSTLADLRMEQVFADVFYDFGEAPTDRAVLRAYIDLVDLYLRVLRETTNWLAADGRHGAPIGKLLAAAAEGSDALTVITFNHDLVIENEINRRTQLRRRWCVGLLWKLVDRSRASHTDGRGHTALSASSRREMRPRSANHAPEASWIAQLGCPPAR